MVNIKRKDYHLILSLISLTIVNPCYYVYSNKSPPPVSLTDSAYNYKRTSTILSGTINFQRISNEEFLFTPRHSHATCVFRCSPYNFHKKCIWLTGGYSEKYRSFKTDLENRNADVWYSETGNTWTKVMNLTGDVIFGAGNYDAKFPGQVAPWYSRYGHSLDALDADGDGKADAMILAGGFDPLPSNDIWITTDGITWYYDGEAPWHGRAYHASAVFKDELWIMGGTPLSNDIWIGRLYKDTSKKAGYKMEWRAKAQQGGVSEKNAPWSPRAGHCAVTQLRRDSYNLSNELDAKYTEYLYVIGGYAGNPYEDRRARNDVWVTENGRDWNRITPKPQGSTTMPWVGRSWHACITWHDLTESSLGVSKAAIDDYVVKNHNQETMHPRIYIIGGGYIGTKGNNVVRTLEGYLDVWWSSDGALWHQVNHEEGTAGSRYSTSDWTLTNLNNNNDQSSYLGKWGHSVEAIITPFDLNKDGVIIVDDNDSSGKITVLIEFCATDDGEDNDDTGADNTGIVKACKNYESSEFIPTLLIIGGDTTDNGPIVNDVFATLPGVHCEHKGVTCNNRGSCGPGTLGCVCYPGFDGEYCERISSIQKSTAFHLEKSLSLWSLFLFGITHGFYILFL